MEKTLNYKFNTYNDDDLLSIDVETWRNLLDGTEPDSFMNKLDALLKDIEDKSIEVIEKATFNELPETGEVGKIYIVYADPDATKNAQYRWTGSEYANIAQQMNYATEEEAVAGIDDTKVMTPAKTKLTIESLGSGIKCIPKEEYAALESAGEINENSVYGVFDDPDYEALNVKITNELAAKLNIVDTTKKTVEDAIDILADKTPAYPLDADLLGGHPVEYFGTAENIIQLEDQINNNNEKIQKTNSRIYNPNLLHNWDFRNPVNQRGQNEYLGNGYTIDEWHLMKESGTDAATLKLTANGIEITSPSDGHTIFEQTIEFSEQYANLPLTLSLKISTHNQGSGQFSIYSYNGTEYEIVTARGSISSQEAGKIISVSGAGNNIMNWMRLRILVGAGTTVMCESIKLELGTVSTLANDPPMDYGAELAKCQRYYERYYMTISSSPRTDIYTFLCANRFFVPKRISPTIRIYNPFTGAENSIRCTGNNQDYNVQITTQENTGFFIVGVTGTLLLENAQYALIYEANAEF